MGSGIIYMTDNKISTGFILDYGMDTPPFKSNAVLSFRLAAVALKRLSKRAHIHVKNSRFQFIFSPFLGHQGFFNCVHTADKGAKVGVDLNVSGSHTLEPGHLAKGFAVGRPDQTTLLQGGAT